MGSELAYINMSKNLYTINTVVSWVSAHKCGAWGVGEDNNYGDVHLN